MYFNCQCQSTEGIWLFTPPRIMRSSNNRANGQLDSQCS